MIADLGEARPAPAVAARPADPGGTLLVRTYLVLLICLPSVWVLGPLGAVGAPAGLVGCGFLLVWGLSRLTAARARLNPTPVHWLLLVFVAGFTAALVAAARRPLLTIEYSAILRGVVTVAGWLGVSLFVADTLRSRERLLTLVRFLVALGTLLALGGYLQFVTGFNLVDHVHLPGLTLHSSSIGTYERNGFRRANGTAIHAIEFATVLSMLLPVAVSQAVRQRTALSVLQALIIAGALPLTVSRSGTLGLAIGFLYTLIVVSRRERWVILSLVPIAAGAVAAVIPGLLGSIRGLFVSAGTDTSITARTDDYPAVEAFFRSAPWLGRGPFTFIPTIYRTLDNQYLGSLVEGGLVGLLAMVGLLVGTTVVAVRVVRRQAPGADRALALALVAALGVAIVLFASFDAYSFPMCMGTVFLTIGLVGAASRVLGQHPMAVQVAPSDAALRRRPRGVRRLAAVGVGVAVLAGSAAFLLGARPAYFAEASLAVAVPPHAGENIYFAKRDTTGVTDILDRVLQSPSMRAELATAGVPDYQVAIGSGSLSPYTDQNGYGDVMRVGTTAPDARTAAAAAATVMRRIGIVLQDLQAGQGIPTSVKVAVVNSTTPEVSELKVHTAVGLAAAAVLGLFASATVGAVLCRLPRRAPAAARAASSVTVPVGA